ncbi:hypothetical protein [Tropicibacter oceani]|uniref:Uncharacterized protein n=1 Tax=Tropicibacter oceani TaxID=3058420 RepID=A0ABY8QH92_9RHOB|nr:hypothetical protein [Tropicibacter oceani]WGW04016.1 hypothetical protein QF118_00315 [Tropicibacter oceani]
MIRPEAAATLGRFREALTGAGVLLLGLYWAFFTGGGLLHWIGYGVMTLGIVLIVTGLQRARFRRGDGGPGIVQVIEGRITYFGPLSGGVADIDALSALTLDPTARPAHWRLDQPGLPPLHIPVNAEGSEALFDAFAHLPGIRTEFMLRELERKGAHPVVIWRAASAQPITRRLH